MSRNKGWGCLRFIFIGVALFVGTIFLASCGVKPEEFDLPQASPTGTNTPLPVEPMVTRTPGYAHRYNFVLLGGDYAEHRAHTGWGDKTDVMLIVSIFMSDPVEIKVVQLPRNLYTEVSEFPDLWAFAVYGEEGFPGVHYYVQEVFDLSVHGVAYINMDDFVKAVSELHLDGNALLEYLRDNENNWDYGVYDFEGRQYKVLRTITGTLIENFREDPVETAKDLWEFRRYIDTDISAFEQLHWMVELAYEILDKGYEIEFVPLREPAIAWEDTPIFPYRGFVLNMDLHSWMNGVLND